MLWTAWLTSWMYFFSRGISTESSSVNLKSKRIECDEIWSFCHVKQKNLPKELQGKEGYGSIWTWVALDSDTELVPTWYVGRRDLEATFRFLEDLEPRLMNKVQLSTDGYLAYAEVIPSVFGKRVNYGMVEKQYGRVYYETDEHERTYSPNECIGIVKKKVQGRPKYQDISTSYVERKI